jgi:hypothetical protein
MKLRAHLIAAAVSAAALAWTTPALAHCDSMDGPVVTAARSALDTGNVRLVLGWVPQGDEAEIRRAFESARSVRAAGGESKALAESYFFETLVRVHRAGEGAGYTGLKAAGNVEPAVAAADKAIETGKLEPLMKAIAERNEKGLHAHFERVRAKKAFGADDVEAARAYANAYVEFVHYAERLHDASGPAMEHGPTHTH